MKNFYPAIDKLVKQPIDFINFINDIPLGILILDLKQRVVVVNRTFEAQSGFLTVHARGMPCRNILRSAACIKGCPVKKITADTRSISCESNMINLDRQLLPIRMTTAPILDGKGKISGYIETIEDLRISKKEKSLGDTAFSFANIIGRSYQMEKIFQTLPVLAQSHVSILITGETGTGKDLVAEAVHQTSGRVSGPFVKINCGALPETLLESELFGHKKGAFTGAVESKPGRFKLAHNGTIFLTEIGDLPLSLQVKLLTFLDDNIIYPLGSTKGFKVNARMIAATHRDLEQMVRQGRFRKDLLFRLNVARVHLPPLREREGDVRLLLDYFLNTYKNRLGRKLNGFSGDVLDMLLNYSFEGNIRELKNIVEYAVNVSNGAQIETRDLPAYITDRSDFMSQGTEIFSKGHGPGTAIRDAALEKKPVPSHGNWAQAEKEMILNALVKAKGKKVQAAKILGWGRSTLWRKIKLHQLE